MQSLSGSTLIRRYYDEIANQADAESRDASIDAVLNPEFVFHTPNDAAGKPGLEQHKAWQVWHHSISSDQTFTVDDIVVDEHQGAARWTLRATHTAQFFGIAATGRVFVVMGMDFFRFSEGQIVEMWRYFDLRETLRQLTDAT